MYLQLVQITTQNQLEKLVDDGVIRGDIEIRGRGVISLENVKIVIGNLKLYESGISTLNNLEEITGDLHIINNLFDIGLTSLGTIKKIGGNCRLRYSQINNLGNLEEVGGDLNLRDLYPIYIGKLKIVKGKLFLNKLLEENIDLNHIKVNGEIRFWKPQNNNKILLTLPKCDNKIEVPFWNEIIFSFSDLSSVSQERKMFYKLFKAEFNKDHFIDLKGNISYLFVLYYDFLNEFSEMNDLLFLQKKFKNLSTNYPEIEIYTARAIEDILEKDFLLNSNNEEIWLRNYNKGNVYLETIIDFENKLNKPLIDAKIILNWGSNTLTPFGYDNLSKIIPYIQIALDQFEKEKNKSFLKVFFKTKEENDNSNERILIDPLSLDENWISYNEEFYKEFYFHEKEFKYERKIDESHLSFNFRNRGSIPRVVSGAIFSTSRKICRIGEDLLRVSLGVPKIGEGWISETSLFYKIDEALPDYMVIHHGSPQWLGRQHLDIFIPELKIAVEYQGRQHSEPIEFFGGLEAFVKNQERDIRKKKLCEENEVNLLYVYPETDRELFLIELLELVADKVNLGVMDKIVPNFWMFCSSGQNSACLFSII